MSGVGYWMHETTGELRPAIEAYLNGGSLTPRQFAAIRAYLRQWMSGPWKGPMIDVLRSQLEEVQTREEMTRWLDRALDAGIDPL